MELLSEHEEELKSVLASNPNGISYVDLCEECYSFDSPALLSKALRLAVHLGIAYKEGKLYYDLDGYNKLRSSSGEEEPSSSEVESKKSDPVTEEIKKLIGSIETEEQPAEPEPEQEARVIPATIKRTVVAPLTVPDKAAVPVTGKLRRTKSLGAAAMALYKFRKERALTLDDLSMLIGTPKTALSGVMSWLVEARYAVKSGSRRCPEFKWSGVFIYPFERYRQEDSRLVLHHSPAAWRIATGQASASESCSKPEPTARVNPNVERPDSESCADVESDVCIPSSNSSAGTTVVDLAIQQIDMEINMCMQQIESLRRVRGRMCGLLK